MELLFAVGEDVDRPQPCAGAISAISAISAACRTEIDMAREGYLMSLKPGYWSWNRSAMVAGRDMASDEPDTVCTPLGGAAKSSFFWKSQAMSIAVWNATLRALTRNVEKCAHDATFFAPFFGVAGCDPKIDATRVGRNLRVGFDGAAAFERLANQLLAGLIESRARHHGGHGTMRCEGKETDVNASRLEALHALEHRRFVSFDAIARDQHPSSAVIPASGIRCHGVGTANGIQRDKAS